MTQVIKLVGKGFKRALHIIHMHRDARERMNVMRKGRYNKTETELLPEIKIQYLK